MAVLVKERRMVCINSPPVTDEWVGFTAYLGRLLGDTAAYLDVDVRVDAVWSGVLDRIAAEEPELIVWQEPAWTWAQRPLRRWLLRRMINRLPGSVLLVRRPRWPLRRLLLICRADGSDAPAVSWTERLATLSDAAVTILPVVPPLPRMSQHGSRVQPPLEVLLSPATVSGAYLQRYAQRLQQMEVKGEICQRTGAADWQIRCEMAQGDYDLAVIAEETMPLAVRWLAGELVTPLLGWLKRPLLLARPTA